MSASVFLDIVSLTGEHLATVNADETWTVAMIKEAVKSEVEGPITDLLLDGQPIGSSSFDANALAKSGDRCILQAVFGPQYKWNPTDGFSISEDGRSITRTGPVGEHCGLCAALASPALSVGPYCLTFKIKRSKKNLGGMYVGVADSSRRAWNFNPYSGFLCKNEDISKTGSQHCALMEGNLKGNAEGASIAIHIDIAQHTLGFSVNGEPEQVVAAEMIPPVQPFLQMYFGEDTVEIVDWG